MEVQYKDEIITLPTWCKTWSEEKINAAAKTVYEDNHKESTRTIETNEPKIDYDHITKELKKEGFTKSQIEEIIAHVECGHTIDSAIQRIL